MPICQKCGIEKPERGFSNHVKFCKGNREIATKQRNPETKNPQEATEKIETEIEDKTENREIETKQGNPEIKNPQEATEKDKNSYTGILITIIALIIGFIAFIVFFALPGDDTDAR